MDVRKILIFRAILKCASNFINDNWIRFVRIFTHTPCESKFHRRLLLQQRWATSDVLSLVPGFCQSSFTSSYLYAFCSLKLYKCTFQTLGRADERLWFPVRRRISSSDFLLFRYSAEWMHVWRPALRDLQYICRILDFPFFGTVQRQSEIKY